MNKFFSALFVTILFFASSVHAQYFRTREAADKGYTVYYRYYPGPITSALPILWEFPDTGKTWRIGQDTILLPKFASKNDNPNALTFLSLNDTGKITGTSKASLLSSVVKYTDTSTIVGPYLRSLNAATLFYPLGSNPAGYLTSVPAQTWASITGKPTTLAGYGITDPIVLTTGTYANPSWITSFDYTKLINTPTIPAAQVNVDWNATTGITQILNKPTLAAVATTGAYADLTGKPTIYSFTGTNLQYTKGDGTYATFPTAVSSFTNDAGYITSVAIAGKLNITDTTGKWVSPAQGALSYYPLTGNPSNFLTGITSGQVTTALGYIPVTNGRTITINGTSFDLSANRTWTVGDVLSTGSYANPSWITSLAWSKITGIPTTLAGYGITDGVTSTSLSSTLSNYVTSSSLTTTLGSYATTASLTSGLAGKENTITTGTTAQYWRGDKSWQTLNTVAVAESTNLYYTNARARAALSLTTTGTGAATYDNTTGILNIPTASNTKRIETYSGITDASGNYTVTYTTAFSVVPDVQPQLQAGTASQVVRITSSTTTGFTVNVTNRASVTLLSVEVLLAATTPVSGASVSILVTSR